MPLLCHPNSPPPGGGAQVAKNEQYCFARVRQAAISNATPPRRGAHLSALYLPQVPQVPLSSTRMPRVGILCGVGGAWAAPRGPCGG